MKRYRVLSKHAVLGHETGAEFEAELDAVQEARLLAGGHLELVAKAKKAEEPEEEE